MPGVCWGSTVCHEASKVPSNHTVPCRAFARVKLWFVRFTSRRSEYGCANFSFDVLSNILATISIDVKTKEQNIPSQCDTSP